MKEHLTSQQVTDWRSGVSDADELLRLDYHLSECAECRALVGEDLMGTAARALQAEFSSAHLTESQLDDYAGRKLLPAEAMQHLDICAECRDDAEDLRQFADAAGARREEAGSGRDARKPEASTGFAMPWWARSMAAAVAITGLGLSVWFALEKRHGAGSPEPAVSTDAKLASNIPPEYRDEVNEALDSGRLHIPASVAGMNIGPVQLRSYGTPDAKEPSLHVVSPLSTAVVEDRPVFRWTPVDGATYSVSVYDDQFRAVSQGVSLKNAEWQPEKPLARGVTYRWEVRAIKGKRVERAPAPTDPEARFSVLSEAEAQRLIKAQAAMPGASLAMGILYADAGALEDASRELISVSESSDPRQKAMAEKLLSQLK